MMYLSLFVKNGEKQRLFHGGLHRNKVAQRIKIILTSVTDIAKSIDSSTINSS